MDLGPRLKVLEIGTGSGYQAAILSKLCRRLYSIERHQILADLAADRFKKLRLTNIVQKVGDGNKGWPEQVPFDRIIITACAPTVPLVLVDQLKSDGFMILPLLDRISKSQYLVKIYRDKSGKLKKDKLMEVRFVPLLPGVVTASSS